MINFIIMKKLVIALVAAIVSFGSLHAQNKENEDWQKIGEATVNLKLDKDKVPVSQAGNFKSIRIKTTDAPVHVRNLIIEYVDGGSQNIAVNRDFKAGAESPVLNLDKVQSRIKEMTIVYRTMSTTEGDKAHVEVWALK